MILFYVLNILNVICCFLITGNLFIIIFDLYLNIIIFFICSFFDASLLFDLLSIDILFSVSFVHLILSRLHGISSILAASINEDLEILSEESLEILL